jgi:hypothetical protein
MVSWTTALAARTVPPPVSTLALRSSEMHSAWPPSAAKCRAVSPIRLEGSGLAPSLRREVRAAAWLQVEGGWAGTGSSRREGEQGMGWGVREGQQASEA